jgi:perosamine synthetase
VSLCVCVCVCVHTFGAKTRRPRIHGKIEAAIGIEQLKKLPSLIEERLDNVKYFTNELKKIDGLTAPFVEFEGKHVFYLHALKFDKSIIGIDRNKFVDAVKAEIPSAILREDTPLMGSGYVRPLYLQPLYQQRATHCSFNCEKYKGQVNYNKGICPNAEKLHYEELITHEYIRPGMTKEDLMDVINAIDKVCKNIHELK